MNTTAYDNETLELTIDDLDSVAGGIGGGLGEATGQIVNGLLNAVGRTIGQVLTGLHEAERTLC